MRFCKATENLFQTEKVISPGKKHLIALTPTYNNFLVRLFDSVYQWRFPDIFFLLNYMKRGLWLKKLLVCIRFSSERWNCRMLVNSRFIVLSTVFMCFYAHEHDNPNFPRACRQIRFITNHHCLWRYFPILSFPVQENCVESSRQ